MKKSFLTILSIICLVACSDNESTKPNTVNEAPEVKSEISKKEDPVPTTISIQEVSRIALVEAEQFMSNAKKDGIDYSSVTETFQKAKLAYDNKEFKEAQKLAVSVRKQIEELKYN